MRVRAIPLMVLILLLTGCNVGNRSPSPSSTSAPCPSSTSAPATSGTSAPATSGTSAPATSGTSAPATSTTSGSTSAPSPTEATTAPPLTTSGGSNHSSVVPVTGGAEAVTWGSVASVLVWHWSQGEQAWRTAATIATTAQNGRLSVTGSVVSGAADATFVIGDPFGGGGRYGYVGIAKGASGWGVLSGSDPTTSRLNIDPRGRIGDGVQAMGFGGGQLATDYQNSYFPQSDQDKYPFEIFWNFDGSGFVRDRSNQFTAADAADPTRSSVELPNDACPDPPRDGSYFVAGVELDRRAAVVGAGQLITVTFPLIVSNGQCTATVSAQLPLTVPVSGHKRWITAPLWLADWIFEQEQGQGADEH